MKKLLLMPLLACLLIVGCEKDNEKKIVKKPSGQTEQSGQPNDPNAGKKDEKKDEQKGEKKFELETLTPPSLEEGKEHEIFIKEGSGKYEVMVAEKDKDKVSARIDGKKVLISALKETPAEGVDVVVKDTELKKEVTIKVVVKKVVKFAVDKQSVEVKKGEKVEVRITKGSGKYEVSLKDSEIAEVSITDGIVTVKGKKKGETKLTITDKEHKESIEVPITVTGDPMQLFARTNPLIVKIGELATEAHINVYNYLGEDLAKSVKVDPSDVLEVIARGGFVPDAGSKFKEAAENGLEIKGLKAGKAKITVTDVDGTSESWEVEVKAVPAVDIVLKDGTTVVGEELSIEAGETKILRITGEANKDDKFEVEVSAEDKVKAKYERVGHHLSPDHTIKIEGKAEGESKVTIKSSPKFNDKVLTVKVTAAPSTLEAKPADAWKVENGLASLNRALTAGETEVILPKEGTKIDKNSLANGKDIIEELDLNKVVSIPGFGISGMTKLKKLILRNVEKIEKGGIYGCKELEVIECHMVNPKENFFSKLIGNEEKLTTILVPKGQGEAYRKALGNVEGMPEKVKEMM